ncbi:Carbohydrate-binding X8 domain superfamily protein [Rhynchospora pubera]|uniref:Carbohydrate-binding X8 domain superfamily protein n=1 Tax=Rhynchospora pubera TaxID=906938 RepID=A0AAV8C2I5_9POAL|nr:Carbohydrate-binding X8 domain superfamily protein [Rhynchospora pubera]KAJ4821523.1 Carbohydrate-binding X8 domain superfamily protein [Rhynchospora pubera]
MERLSMNLSSYVLLLYLISGGGMVVRSQSEKTWCVAKPSTDEVALVDNISYACSIVDCTILQEGHSCFYPNNNISHASIAMNLYFQSRGRNNWNCDFKNSGLIVSTDPSFGGCIYPFGNY